MMVMAVSDYGYLTVAALIENLQRHDPKLRVVGHDSGSWYFGTDNEVREMHIYGEAPNQQPSPCSAPYYRCGACEANVPKERLLVL
jgi:hypothetical protein